MALRFGALTGSAAHLCIDMQALFAEKTDWHVPWMRRVIPSIVRIVRRYPERTVFTRFVPPQAPAHAQGTWRRYYERWRHLTGEHIEPHLLELVPPLATFVPPAVVIDKQHYSPFAEPGLSSLLSQRNVDTLLITGGETDVCVLATVMGAVDLGYRVVLASDGLCSVSDEMHDSLLRLYGDRFSQQVETASTDEILESWR